MRRDTRNETLLYRIALVVLASGVALFFGLRGGNWYGALAVTILLLGPPFAFSFLNDRSNTDAREFGNFLFGALIVSFVALVVGCIATSPPAG